MVRILGNNIPNKKKLGIALTAIYGIGRPTAQKILAILQISLDLKAPDLTEKNVSELRELLESDQFKVEGNLRRIMEQNISRLKEIKCFRGRRHEKSLPTRGQRTRTNSRTVRRELKSKRTPNTRPLKSFDKIKAKKSKK